MILIAEDQFLIADDIRLELQGGGYRVQAVSSARDALGIVEAELPAAAVVDLQLTDGYTGKQLAQELAERGVPVIVCTGYEAQAEGDLSFCHVVIPKPAPKGAVLNAVRGALGRASAIRSA